MLTSLLLAAAFAQDGTSRLHISVDRPVGILVDGRVLEYAEDGPYGVLDGLQAGRHQISVRSMTNAEIWTGLVDTPAGYEVRCAWKAKAFSCYEAVAIAAPAQVIVAPPPPRPPVAGASVTVTETTTTTSGSTSSTVTMGVGMPFFGVVVTEGAPATTTTTTTVTTKAPAPPPPPARALPAKVEVIFRSLDGEWTDVRIDGKVALELRNQDEGTVWLTPGTHTIELIEFMEDRPYASGRLDTGYAARVTFGLTENQPATVYDHDGWTPS
jgi:hypothetical protein